MDKNINSIKNYLVQHANLTGTYKLAYINDQLCNIMNSNNIDINGYTNNGEEIKDYITSGIPKQKWTPSMKEAVNKINLYTNIGLWTTWTDNKVHVVPTKTSDLVESINAFE